MESAKPQSIKELYRQNCDRDPVATELVSQLKTIIADELDVNLTVEEIDDNVSLFEEGLGFDSIAIVEFISAIEKHFDIEFDDSELDPQYFSSLQVLADLISRKVDS